MSVLEQNHNLYDDSTVLETVLKGNKPLYYIKTEIDALYNDYNDSNADKIELQVKFEEMNGWNADSDAAAMLSNLGIKEDLHYLSMSDLDGKQKLEFFWLKLSSAHLMYLLWMSQLMILIMRQFCGLRILANYDNCVIVVSHDRHFLIQCVHIFQI